jgi:hypothetical protein
MDQISFRTASYGKLRQFLAERHVTAGKIEYYLGVYENMEKEIWNDYQIRTEKILTKIPESGFYGPEGMDNASKCRIVLKKELDEELERFDHRIKEVIERLLGYALLKPASGM